jgi:uncharacterized protein
MKLRLNALTEGSQTLTMTLSKSDLAISDGTFTNPISVTLAIDKETHQITVKGRLNTEVELICDRCLESFNYPLTVDFQTIISQLISSSDNQDENILPITAKSNEVDLTPFARDALLTGLPMKNICSESCRGICPGCGKNLNIDTCICQTSQIDDRWKPLENLLTNLSKE